MTQSAESPQHDEPGAVSEPAGAPTGFTAWRTSRPFLGGLFMILSGLIILMPAYLSLEVSNIMIQISTMSGVSTFIIGALLVVSGLMTWFGGGSRFLTGVAALILGLVALPTSNFGGFIIGTLFALIGGALALAWTDFSKEDANRAKQEKRAAKAERRNRGNSAANGTAVVGAVLATALGTTLTAAVDTPTAQAQLQLPNLGELKLPKVPDQLPQLPGAPAPGGNAPGGTDPARPAPNGTAPGDAVPKLPKLPKPPTPPKPPKLPGLPKPPKVEVPEDLEMDLTPPAPLNGLHPVTGQTFTIKTDSTALLGDMKLSLVTMDTQQGAKPALRIDANKAVLDNLSMAMPGLGGQELWQRTGAGTTSVLEGNFHIIVKRMTVTPAIAGVKTFPLTIDAEWAPEKIRKEAAKMGLGQPDKLAENLKMLDAELDTYLVTADAAHLPHGTSIAP